MKYWLGGQDPLDYISIYDNEGQILSDIPPHWHYISFGLSDLHGDGRVHPMHSDCLEDRSGLGFELTFRLKKTPDEIKRRKDAKPPTWPANLLQNLAKYVFQTGNLLCVGDNIPYNKILSEKSPKIKHILIGEDVVMSKVNTKLGYVDFLQIIGATDEELEQAIQWNGNGVIGFLRLDTA